MATKSDASYQALRSPRFVDEQRLATPTEEQSQDAWTTRSRSGEEADARGYIDGWEVKSKNKRRKKKKTKTQTAKKPLPPKVSLLALYRFATPRERALLALACVLAGLNGALYPCMAIVFGHAIDAFDPFDKHAVNRAALEYLAIAVALLATDSVAYAAFGALSERQVRAMRETALQHLLHMDAAWFDEHSNEVPQLTSRLTADTTKIRDGMGQKLGELLNVSAQFVAGYAIGLVQSWDLALVMSCVTPLTVWSMSFLLQMVRANAKLTQDAYAEAGAVAEETLAAMRTVASLNAEARAIARYDAKSQDVERASIAQFRRAAPIQGLFTGSVWLMYAVGLWYGGWKVYQRELPPGVVFQAFFGIVIGTRPLGQISPNLKAVGEAQAAAFELFRQLDSRPAIDAASDRGLVPPACDGQLAFHDVHFAYPSRPDAPVLRGLELSVAAGQTVAFVGPSGGGKSTLVALLERFYDPTRGRVLLDGRDLRELNVAWLRRQIGLVAQEPVLFRGSVADNIAMGCAWAAETESETELSHEQLVAAARLAHAHDFISRLPNGYATLVGEHGAQLSGGQRQRLAIARALVRKPRVLVLDEATSALDTESEAHVQAALLALLQRQPRMTTLVVAHRLSTVRAADCIFVLAGGRVAERGSHDALLAREGGVYRALVAAQAFQADAADAADVADTADAAADAPPPPPSPRDDAPPTSEAADSDAAQEQQQQPPPLASPRSTQPPAPPALDAATVATTTTKTTTTTTTDARGAAFTMRDAMRLSAPEASHYARGMAAAVVHGLSLPASALLLSHVVALMTERYGVFLATRDRRELRALAADVRASGVYYVAVAVAVGIAHAAQVFHFRLMAARLTRRLRHVHFAALCRQDMAFFDDEAHSTGALASALSLEAQRVSLVSGDAHGRVVQAATTLAAAVLLSFVSGSWQLTLVLLAALPCLLWGETARNRHLKGAQLATSELAAAAAQASQALASARTVAALGLERTMARAFSRALDEPMRLGVRQAAATGVAVGYSNFVVFATYALVFWYGGALVERGAISFRQLMRTLMAILMASQGVGFAMSWLGEAADATKAGAAIVAVRDRPHAIDALRDDGETPTHVEGRIEFQDVSFRYPSRPDAPVLAGFSLSIAANETVGLCGASGGGKSTVAALLERFYDPTRGRVLLDGRDLRTLNVAWLRRQIGYVGQEPVLFRGSVADNIAFGLKRAPTPQQIEAAARLAHAHEFISRLPDAYETEVGARGALLSGGQKQRVAIARAVLREPRVLLLDEATSALDAASEALVQAALDALVAQRTRTTLVVAHRLATLRRADRVCVVHQGRVAESGAHDELLQRAPRGLYARLQRAAASEAARDDEVRMSSPEDSER